MKRFAIVPPGAMLFLFLELTGCTTPARLLNEKAWELGFERLVLQGTDFQHVAYRNGIEGQRLHIYLDGDGKPWRTRVTVAADPTPRNPLLLKLMAQDTEPSLYLGRPCYHGLYASPPCNWLLWTSRRYGPEIVNSMASALDSFLMEASYDGLIFIGYSGGGALAMLLAERFAQTRGVLTIAGNLDPERWAAWHGYSSLDGSLNPARRPSLGSAIVQLHFVGAQDKNIPPFITDLVVSQQPCAKLTTYKKYDHTCCWEAVWPSILEALALALTEKTVITRCAGNLEPRR